MKIDRIQPEGMSVRLQQGKPAYSHVVTVTGPGKTIYIAGQLARDAEGNIVGPGDMRAQLEQTFKNLDACLKWRRHLERIDVLASWKRVWNQPRTDIETCLEICGLGEGPREEEGW